MALETKYRITSPISRRALWNLLDNAAKYSPKCQTIWVEVSLQDKHLSIGVRDRGLGIPADEQKEVFKRFVRGAGSKAAGVKGTGLGLAMVRHIACAHGGKVFHPTGRVSVSPDGKLILFVGGYIG